MNKRRNRILNKLLKDQGNGDIKGQRDLEELALWANRNIRAIMSYFGVEYTEGDLYISSRCFLHGGDNPQAFGWYYGLPEYPTGFWNCYTKNCGEGYSRNIFGLVQLLNDCSMVESIRFVRKMKTEINTDEFNGTEIKPVKKKKKEEFSIDAELELYRKHNKPEVVSEFMRSRGYEQFIRPYDVMFCPVNGNKLWNRIIFPVKNLEGEIVGFTGRHLEERWKPKWLHHGFKSSQNMFNMFHANWFIRNRHEAILVEGPFDVMKLVMGGYRNCLAVFGSKLQSGHKKLLVQAEVNKVFLLLDADEAGQRGVRQTKTVLDKHSNGYFDIVDLSVKLPNGKDVDKLTEEEFEIVTGEIK